MITDHNWLIVKAKLFKTSRASLVWGRRTHHAGDEADQGVLVGGVGDGAGLDHVPIAFPLAMLAFKLVCTINLCCLKHIPIQQSENYFHTHSGKPIRPELHLHILANSFIHGWDLLGYEAGAVWAKAFINDVYLKGICTKRCGKGDTETE